MQSNRVPLTAAPCHVILLASTSASVLAYEILLMRLLSIGQWHHYAYMVISMALMGFGAAGSLLFLFFHRIRGNLEEWLIGLAGATAVSFPLFFSLSQKTGLDPLQLVWQPYQWLNMLVTYLIMAVPFLLSGGIVGIILTGAGKKTHRMYAFDLLGAGCGALVIVPALYLGPPWSLLPPLGCLVLLGGLGCCLRARRPFWGTVSLVIWAGILLMVYMRWPPLPVIHETKTLPMTLAFPDARIEAEEGGPLGMIQVVGSALIRHVPGLSLNFGLGGGSEKATIPEQKAIFTDADALSPITHFKGDLHELLHLDFTTMALPYHIRQPETVLVLGAGGGSDVLLSLRHGTPRIIALEANPQIVDLLLGPFARFSGDLYLRPQVKILKREARQYLHASEAQFDQIHLSLLDSFGASAGGVYSAEESYLYTKEAFKLYLSRLSRKGLLSVTRWLKLPPRDSLRVLATALAALLEMDFSDKPEKHLLFIRSWKTSTILASRTPFTREEILHATRFCDERSFDLAYYAGMKEEQANRFDIHDSPYYYMGAKALTGPDAESFLRHYLYDVSPTADDRPYFSNFFRWKKAAVLFHHLRREMMSLIEYGHLFIYAALVQAVIGGGILILAPLLFLGWVQRGSDAAGSTPRAKDILMSLVFFGSIGMAFMFFEMALLPGFTLLLSHPVYSAALVLSSVLAFAGLGSLFVQRLQPIRAWILWIPVIFIAIWVGLYALAWAPLVGWSLKWPLIARFILAVSLLSLPSFFMGWPFPTGLRATGERFPTLVPWAWGINGCASVIGAVLGKCLAVGIGFRWLMATACVLYFIGISVFQMTFRDVDKEAFRQRHSGA
ncbi:MAG: SAM-dependent methyltransferase [Pseudomonadota bacterium]